MAALARGDEGRILSFVAEAESFGGDHPFEGEFLTQLGRLVPAGWIGYIGDPRRDHHRQAFYRPDCEPHPYFVRPGDESAYAAVASTEGARKAIEEAPTFAYLEGNVGTVKISDFLTSSDLHGTPLYSLVFQPEGFEDSISLRLPVAPAMAQFVFDRGTNFGERDRAVLEALTPHLVRLYRAYETRERLRVALALHESAGAAVVLLEPDGRVAFASTPARRLLDRYFGTNGAGLPEPVASWLAVGRRDVAELLRVEGGHRTLVVERAGDALLLEEQRTMPVLTPREREVLELVAEGRTNGEIADLLWLSTGTVRKHLDNLYAKLGVHTRTAAASFFRDGARGLPGLGDV